MPMRTAMRLPATIAGRARLNFCKAVTRGAGRKSHWVS